MPCVKPLTAFKKPGGGVSFSKHGTAGVPLSLPCGRCIGCRIDQTTAWKARILHETRLHPWSIFATLTYRPESVPDGGTLVPKHLTDFWKRLRKQTGKFRYFAIGEYGEQTHRPHYHAIIFGYFPKDAKEVRRGETHRVYSSVTLENTWGHGFISFSEANPENAGYIAGYCTKKLTGDLKARSLERVSPDGELYSVAPEYSVMSRRPGIGAGFYTRFKTDLYPSNFIVVGRGRARIPRFYDSRLEQEDPQLLEKMRDQRRKHARKKRVDSTPERLEAREACMKARLQNKTRKLENWS